MPVAITLPIPESTRVCLNPPPAATINKILAIEENERPTREFNVSLLHFARIANNIIAKIVVIVRASSGVPIHAITLPNVDFDCPVISTTLAASIRITGSKITLDASANVGRFCGLSSFLLSSSCLA